MLAIVFAERTATHLTAAKCRTQIIAECLVECDSERITAIPYSASRLEFSECIDPP